MPALDPPPPHSVTFIASLGEVFFLLYGRIGEYDLDPECTHAVMAWLLEDVLGGQDGRSDPVGSAFDSAMDQLRAVGMSAEEARQLAVEAGDLIITQITNVIPNFGSGVYKNAYEYHLGTSNDVYISVHRSVFTSADVSAPRSRPYRL